VLGLLAARPYGLLKSGLHKLSWRGFLDHATVHVLQSVLRLGAPDLHFAGVCSAVYTVTLGLEREAPWTGRC